MNKWSRLQLCFFSISRPGFCWKHDFIRTFRCSQTHEVKNPVWTRAQTCSNMSTRHTGKLNCFSKAGNNSETAWKTIRCGGVSCTIFMLLLSILAFQVYTASSISMHGNIFRFLTARLEFDNPLSKIASLHTICWWPCLAWVLIGFNRRYKSWLGLSSP